MDCICTWCGELFGTKKFRRTCSDKCHLARMAEATRQIRAKKGAMYETWKARLVEGTKVRDEKLRRKKRR